MKLRQEFIIVLLFFGSVFTTFGQNKIAVGTGVDERLELEFAQWETEALFFEGWFLLEDLERLQPLVTFTTKSKSWTLLSSWRSGEAAGPVQWRSSQLALFLNQEWDGGAPLWVSPLALEAGDWFHFAMHLTSGEMEIFIDGVSLGAALSSVESDWAFNLDSQPFSIGVGMVRDRDQHPHTFRGAIDEIRLWNRNRAIRELRSTMPLRLTAAEAGSVACFNFDGADSLQDRAGQRYIVTDTFRKEDLVWEKLNRRPVNEFSSLNIEPLNLWRLFVREASPPSVAIAKFKSGEPVSTWMSNGFTMTHSWLEMSTPDEAIHYQGFIGDHSIGEWTSSGKTLMDPFEVVSTKLWDSGKYEVSDQEENLWIQRKYNRMDGLPVGFRLSGAPRRLLDGRWVVAGKQGVFWWDGIRFHPFFRYEVFEKLDWWVEVYPGVVMVQADDKWYALQDLTGFVRTWSAIQVSQSGYNWTSDHAGRIWASLEDQTIEIRLNTDRPDEFWERWVTSGSGLVSETNPRWVVNKIKDLPSVELIWDESRRQLWSIGSEEISLFNHDEERSWTLLNVENRKLLEGRRNLMLGSGEEFWIASAAGLSRFENTTSPPQTYEWPRGFGLMGSGDGRIHLAPAGASGVWALDGNNRLGLLNENKWVWRKLNSNLKFTDFFAVNAQRLWLVADDSIWLEVESEETAIKQHSSGKGLAMRVFGMSEARFNNFESNVSARKKDFYTIRTRIEFPEIEVIPFGEMKSEEDAQLDHLIWRVSEIKNVEAGSAEGLERIWISGELEIQAGARQRLGWEPNRPGTYLIEADLLDSTGEVYQQKSIALIVGPFWNETVWAQTIIRILLGTGALGMLLVFWKGFRAWKFQSRVMSNLETARMDIVRLSTELDEERIKSETAQNRLIQREKDLREIRFELIGRLHEEIRPLLEYVLPGAQPGSEDTSIEHDSEFQEKVRESLQFLSDLCLVELDHREGDRYQEIEDWFSLSEIIAEMERWFRISCDHKGIRLKTELYVLGDPATEVDDLKVRGPFDLVRSVLFNLVSNAIHYTQRGEVTISLRLGRSRRSEGSKKHQLQVEVIDTGSGIPAEEIERIIEPGYRGSNARQQWRPGKGTGLFIVRKALDSIGAELGLESVVGKGSRFSFVVGIEIPESHPVFRNASDLAGADHSSKIATGAHSSAAKPEPPSPELVALWDELMEVIRYGKWREASLLALELKKKNACDLEDLNYLGEILLRQGKEEALDWVRRRRPITD